MGKAGRVACIITPMALTVGSLICLLLVLVGQMSNNGKAPTTNLQADLWFFKANTSAFDKDPQGLADKLADKLDKLGHGSDLLNAITGSAESNKLEGFYKVGLWSYCSGKYDDTGVEKYTYCSPSKTNFYFNPVDVWGLKNTSVQNVLGDDFQKGLDTYKKVAGWMNWAFIIATILTAAEFVIGFFAIFSRWGSLVVTIISTASSIFTIAAAATATGVYGVLTGVFKTALEDYEIEASMGNKMLQVMWLGVAFSIASGLSWLLSVCCCSGSSGHKKTVVEKTPYSYERVSSPAFGQSGHQLQTAPAFKQGHSGTAYEPYRGQV